MTSVNRVLIIGGNKKILKKAKDLNISVINVQKKSSINSELLELADQTFELEDYENIDILYPIVKQIYESSPFKCAISLTESGLVPAAYVNSVLKLQGNSLETIMILKNKQAMRNILNKNNVSPVPFKIGYGIDDIYDFLVECGESIILKPIDASGSLGIFRIERCTNINEIWENINNLGLQSFIMEEYIDGQEISVEAFSFNGKHKIIGITDKYTQENFVEIGHSMPSQLEANMQKEVIDLVIKFLDTVGLKDGPSHTEIKISSKGPKIIESHNRIGGDRIGELVNIAYDIDLISLTFKWAFNMVVPPNSLISSKRGAAIRFFTPPEGIVTEIKGVTEILDNPYLVDLHLDKSIGDEVHPVYRSSDRSGYVIAKGNSSMEAIDNCNIIMGRIRIITE